MNAMRFLKVVIVLLLLINIGTLGFLWMGGRQYPPHDRRDGPDKGPVEFLIHELKMTAAQIDKFDGLRHQHHSRMIDLRQQASGFRQRINSQLSAPVPDSLLIRRLSDSIGYCQREAEMITYDHFREVRQLCTPEQQQTFDKVIEGAIQMLGR